MHNLAKASSTESVAVSRKTPNFRRRFRKPVSAYTTSVVAFIVLLESLHLILSEIKYLNNSSMKIYMNVDSVFETELGTDEKIRQKSNNNNRTADNSDDLRDREVIREVKEESNEVNSGKDLKDFNRVVIEKAKEKEDNARIISEDGADDGQDTEMDDEKDDSPIKHKQKNKKDGLGLSFKEMKRKEERLNVVILYPDDWRHDSIGKENPIIHTPFLDSLADEGIRFRQNAATTSVCWDSRATLFSGQWLSHHQSSRLYCPHFSREENWNHTWPKLLQDDGYYVGHVGKWQYLGNNSGRFDVGYYHEGSHIIKDGKHITDKTTQKSIDFLRGRPKDKPFAVTVAFYPPKAQGRSEEPGGQWSPKKETRAIYENMTIPQPYNFTHAYTLLPSFLQNEKTEARKRFHQRYRTPHHYEEAMKNMYALISQVDEACRQVVEEIKRQDLYNNTMIIFTTDHGMFHGSHGLAGKWYPYQESIRNPLIVYDPRMPADRMGTVDDSFTLNVDLATTILGAAGLDPDERMQGRDISDLYLPNKGEGGERTALEENPWRDEFFYEFFFEEERSFPSSHALIRKKWKLMDFYNFNHTLLYNLEEDPMEFTDVKDRPENSEILAEMRETLSTYVDHYTLPEESRLPCVKKRKSYWLSKNPTDT